MTGEFTIAIHALVYLNHKGTTICSQELSENICAHPTRIRKIMAKLKKHNLVATKEGVSGGYYFELDPKKTTLRQVIDALDEPLVSTWWRSGNEDMECLIASGMANIMDDIYTNLNQFCRDKLDSLTIYDIDQKIFG